ncbi:hypothetical protein F1737_09050 [Methanoplanus sp. FWC-SCC4]|uniref:Uncharacterized protein n=1 Tax=Methanochimaera problematica TaxID=2609417 RepID=A0AA97I4D4_9EURY|nr:hypothetical protein [Methanoplanus sp. FWC-SCC4]WOF16826.1 hypothetical protein F1737_09050 [Methanoplanus sp. FWC-SCC4]
MNYSQVAQADLLSNHADQIIDLTDPNVLVTTYGDLGLMILIIGLICLISGYLIGSMRDVDYGKPE